MTPDDIVALFTRTDGSFLCARWGRPIAPVIFGVDETVLPVLKGTIESVVAVAGHSLTETDPELGANLMLFFCKDWDELAAVPNLGQLVPEFDTVIARLKAANANQYRIFRFDDAGAIRACFVFIRMDAALASLPAATIALSQAVQTILLWSDQAFLKKSPLADADGIAVLRPEIALLIRAAYAPTLPDVADDASHALRMFARMAPRA